MASVNGPQSGNEDKLDRYRHTSKDKPTLGVSVVDFDRLAVHGVDTGILHVRTSSLVTRSNAYISPGLVALGPGMFSVNGVTTIKLILEPS